MLRKLMPLLLLVLVFSACVPGSELDVVLETTPNSQVTDETVVPSPEAPTPTPTQETIPLPADGVLRGAVCYPSEGIPAMTAFFREVNTQALVTLEIAENQPSYEVSLPVGQYIAFAYRDAAENRLGGAYTQAVLCGLSIDCSDHSLIEVDIQPGQAYEGADLCDWYAQDMLPVKPNVSEPADASVPGLVLYDPGAGLWQVQADGSASWIYAQTGAKSISPDGSRLLFVKDDDIWLAERDTGVLRNLTRTADRFEFDPQWWAANPSVVVFGSVSLEEGLGPSSGHLSRVNLDGSGYQVLEDQSTSLNLPALNPDGQTIAYDTGDQAWLYRLDGSRELFDPAAYGLQGVQRIASPSYSPDGSLLAWWVGLGSAEAGTWKNSLVVFDLRSASHQILHEYTPVGGGGWSTSPVWSPDGQGLATIALGDMGKATLWAFDLAGNKFNLGASGNPVWSPDSQRLVYIEWTSGSYQEAAVKQLRPADGTIEVLALQPGRIPFAWVANP